MSILEANKLDFIKKKKKIFLGAVTVLYHFKLGHVVLLEGPVTLNIIVVI